MPVDWDGLGGICRDEEPALFCGLTVLGAKGEAVTAVRLGSVRGGCDWGGCEESWGARLVCAGCCVGGVALRVGIAVCEGTAVWRPDSVVGMICVEGRAVLAEGWRVPLMLGFVAGAGVIAAGRFWVLAGAGGGLFAPVGKIGFLITTGGIGVAVFGDSTGFGAGAGTAVATGFIAGEAAGCGFGRGAVDVAWLAGWVNGFAELSAFPAGCGITVNGCWGWIEGDLVAAAGA